jgi:hypothetical protein
MARWHGLGLLMLLAGCSLDTGPNAASIVSHTGTPTWSPSSRPATREQPQTSAAHDAGSVDAAAPDKQEDPEPAPPRAADTNPTQPDAGARVPPSQPSAANTAGTPAQDAGSPTLAGSSADGAAAGGGKAPKPPVAQPPSGSAPNQGGADPASGMSTPGKQAGGDKGDKDRGSRRHPDDESDDDKRGSANEKHTEPSTDNANAVTPTSDGTLSLLFTSVYNLVYSILQFSFGPAQPANITNLIVSIVTLATLPASDVTTATLTDLLDQLDASNVCHDDHSACEALCETLIASCDLYKSDPHSVKSVERNCGSKSLAACK